MSLPSSWLNQCLGNPPRYRLDQSLSSGSFGDVFLAMDLRLGRRVAVKILKGALTKHRDLLLRFEREVALSVALESEHIVQIIDYGVALDEHPFYVMEYLQGKTLSQLLRQQKYLSVEQAVAIIVQICAGLDVAHTGVTLWRNEATVAESIKIIHRDLKPANIFLISTPLGELVKILDFGIAKKLYTDEQSEQTKLTQAFLGTFRYASPEQLKNAWQLDERADIYSLGMIFYEMLSGTDPFGVSTRVSAQRIESAWAMAHTSIAPIPLRQQSNCQQISPELEAAVMRCLCKQPDERFASVAELRRSLDDVRSQAAIVLPMTPKATEPTMPHALILSQDLPQSLPQSSQGTTIYRPIARYVAAQSIENRTIFQSKNLAKMLSDADQDEYEVENTMLDDNPNEKLQSKQPKQQLEQQVRQQMADFSSTAMTGEPPRVNRFPPDATIVQIPSPHETNAISDTTHYQAIQRNAQASHDATMVQGSASSKHFGHAAKPTQPSEQHHRNQISDGLLERAKAWLQASASNYGDRIRAQASAEVRYTAYRLLIRLLPAGIGFAFGLASLSGAYFLFRGQSSHSPARQVPSQIR